MVGSSRKEHCLRLVRRRVILVLTHASVALIPCVDAWLTTTDSTLLSPMGRRFFFTSRENRHRPYDVVPIALGVYAPPGSGYATPQDEKSALPDTYEPMMEFPGTMRPGKTPENSPFHDLPIADDDPDPVPWPHFQQIQWHHRWEPPHPHPIPMEEFIEQQGRWATPEMEAAMRAGVRRDLRARREQAESNQRDTIITDDDDEDDIFDPDAPVALGDGIFGSLGSSSPDQVPASSLLSSKSPRDSRSTTATTPEDEFDDDDLDAFLLDLGLDAGEDDVKEDDNTEEEEDDSINAKRSAGPKVSKKKKSSDIFDDEFESDVTDDFDPLAELGDVEVPSLDVRSSSGDISATINVEDERDLYLGLDDDDEGDDDEMEGGVSTVPLDEFGDGESSDTEDIFDEGGFDFDAGDYDMDGGDNW